LPPISFVVRHAVCDLNLSVDQSTYYEMAYRFQFRQKFSRICQSLGNRIAKIKQSQGHRKIEQDEEVIRCRKMDVVIELNDVLAGRAPAVEEGGQVTEGYGLKEGICAILFSLSISMLTCSMSQKPCRWKQHDFGIALVLSRSPLH
jgi:hypothetical protein